MPRIHITTDAEWQAHFEAMGRQAHKRHGRTAQSPYMVRSRAHAAWQKGFDSCL